MNYYVVLGVPHEADTATIRGAFRALARRYHPDAGEGSSSDRFRDIVVAYRTLADPTRREQYDQLLRSRRQPVSPVIEPLIVESAVESMVRHHTSVPGNSRYWNSRYEPLWADQIEALINDLMEGWEEALLSDRRRWHRIK